MWCPASPAARSTRRPCARARTPCAAAWRSRQRQHADPCRQFRCRPRRPAEAPARRAHLRHQTGHRRPAAAATAPSPTLALAAHEPGRAHPSGPGGRRCGHLEGCLRHHPHRGPAHAARRAEQRSAIPPPPRRRSADSLHRAQDPTAILPPLLTADAGTPIRLPVPPAAYVLQPGRRPPLRRALPTPPPAAPRMPAILEPGYHQLEIGGAATLLAVAPHQGFTAPEAMHAARGWGLAVQLYALRRQDDAGLGDFTALAALAAPAARHGAHAIGISPVHAQFTADPDRFSPYAPSSRTALNVLHADPGRGGPYPRPLPRWSTGRPSPRHRLAASAAAIVRRRPPGSRRTARHFATFRATQGNRLRVPRRVRSAARSFLRPGSRRCGTGAAGPPPARIRTAPPLPRSPPTTPPKVDFHAWLQFRADCGLAAAQAACRAAGMGIGLVSDLAVGTDSGGSQCWSRQSETLLGLTVGAPPDLLQTPGPELGPDRLFATRGPGGQRLCHLSGTCCRPRSPMPAACASTTRWA